MGLCSGRFAGAITAMLCMLAALGLMTGMLCLGGACTQELLVAGRPLSAWGAAAYTIALAAFIYAPRAALAPFTILVLLIHGGIYMSHPVPCPVCVGTIIAEVGMVVLAFRVSAPLGFAYPIPLMAGLLAFVVLLITPSTPAPVTAAVPVIASGGPTVSSQTNVPGPTPVATTEDKGKDENNENNVPDITPGNTIEDTPVPVIRPEAGSETELEPENTESLVQLKAADGTISVADLRTTPVVVIAPRCKHCERVIKDVAVMDDKPILALTRAHGDGLGQFPGCYIILGEDAPRSVPALLYWNGEQRTVTGQNAVLNYLAERH